MADDNRDVALEIVDIQNQNEQGSTSAQSIGSEGHVLQADKIKPLEHHHDHDHDHDHNHHGHDHASHKHEHSVVVASVKVKRALSHGSSITPWYRDCNFYKLVIMLCMIVVYFFAELVIGIIGGSLALIADSFHMLSDGIGLVIGLVGLVLATKKSTNTYSFGFGRAEVLGALINAVFLLSVTIFIVLDAVERFIEPKAIEQPFLVLGVAVGGALINIIGLIMFCGHAHHGGHDHGHSHSHDHHKHEQHDSHSNHHHDDHHHHHENHDAHNHDATKSSKKHKAHKSENLCGVFLHVFGDFLGSIGVIISCTIVILCNYFAPPEAAKYTVYIDPIVSLFIAAILFVPTVPLLVRCCKVLMQTVPQHINTQELVKELKLIKGVQSVHHLHVWSMLKNNKTIGTVHLQLQNNEEEGKDLELGNCEKRSSDKALFMQVAHNAKQVFHKYQIHSSTIQIEYGTKKNEQVENECNMVCGDNCEEEWCCEGESAELERFIKD